MDMDISVSEQVHPAATPRLGEPRVFLGDLEPVSPANRPPHSPLLQVTRLDSSPSFHSKHPHLIPHCTALLSSNSHSISPLAHRM
jgi:hypothetical protein